MSEAGGEEHKQSCMICKHRRGDCNRFINSNNYSGRRGWETVEPLLAICLSWDGWVKHLTCRRSQPDPGIVFSFVYLNKGSY